jgi:hypothetical protein
MVITVGVPAVNTMSSRRYKIVVDVALQRKYNVAFCGIAVVVDTKFQPLEVVGNVV